MMLYKLLEFLGIKQKDKPNIDDFDIDYVGPKRENWYEDEKYGLSEREKEKFRRSDKLYSLNRLAEKRGFSELTEYPKWKKLITDKPSTKQFEDAWISKYKYPFKDCEFKFDLYGASIKTPEGGISDGSYIPFTDNPKSPFSRDEQSFYYSGYGCTWNTDANGDRFQLLSKHNNLPYDWEGFKNNRIIYNYMINKDEILKLEKRATNLDKLIK